jgi:hypothetical protein
VRSDTKVRHSPDSDPKVAIALHLSGYFGSCSRTVCKGTRIAQEEDGIDISMEDTDDGPDERMRRDDCRSRITM